MLGEMLRDTSVRGCGAAFEVGWGRPDLGRVGREPRGVQEPATGV